MKTLNFKILALFAFFVGLSIVAGIFVLKTTSKQKADSVVINLAGKQRMLSQKMTKEALAVTQGTEQNTTLKKTAALFDKTLKGLLNGDAELGLPPTGNPEIIAQLESVTALWKDFRKNIEIVMSDSGKRTQAMNYIRENNLSLLKEMNKAVQMFEKEAKSNVDRLQVIQAIAVGIVVVIVLLGWFFIVNPLVKVFTGMTNEINQRKEALSKSEEQYHSFVKTLNAKILALFAFFVGLSIVAGIFVLKTTSKQKADSVVINLAGKQRMLSQKMTKEALAVTQGTEQNTTLKKTAALFDKTLKGLLNGDAELGLPPTGNPEIIAQLESVTALWKDFRKNIEIVMSDSGKRTQAMNYIRENNLSLLKEMNKAVQMFEKEAKSNVDRLQVIQAIAVGIVVVIVLLGWFFIVNPLLKVLTGMINEINQREEALSKSEARYYSLTDTAKDAIISADRDENIISWNKSAAKMFCYKEDEVLGKSITMLMPERYRDAHKKGIKQIKTTGEFKMMQKTEEMYGLRKDKKEFSIEISFSYWKTGKDIFYSSIIRDITERKQLEDREIRLGKILENSFNEIYIFDAETLRFIQVNQGGRENLQYSMEELHSLTPIDIMPEHTLESFAEIVKPLKKGDKNKIHFTTVHRRKDGSLYPVDVYLQLSSFESSPVFVAIILDITERKQAEEKINKLSQAVEQSPVSIVITNAEGNIEYVNPKFTDVTGYSHEEVIGENPRFLKSGEKSSEMYKELWEAITSGSEWYGEFHNKKKNGELYWEFASISPIKNTDGKITHFLAVKEDITDRKRIEDELAKERLKLEETVDTRTQELRKSLSNLEKVNLYLRQAKQTESNFLSSMSHELRTPLNSILGFSDLLREQFFGKLNSKQLNYVDQIDNSGKHLLSLINDLLDITKIDADAMDIELDDVSPQEFIDATLALMGNQFKKKNISVKVSIGPLLKSITADVRKCKQIMLNLLSNAAKFTPKNGRVVINILKYKESQVRIEVIDTGIGIEPEEIKNIFSEFHQADRVRDEQLGGTGIGLALTRRLVKLHGGEIGVESEPGKGSTFCFTLPLKKSANKISGKKEEKINTERTFPTGHRILVAEDNEVNLAMILDMLKIHDHKVTVAKNGREVIDLAHSHKPELILMDVRMPVMDGMEATQHLRTIPEFSDIPIIALTASADSESIKRHIASGCTEHLAKPIQSQKLFSVLNKYLKTKGEHPLLNSPF